jgi:hypothetical protein
MRIWDIRPIYLCRQHLLGEHLELHAIWSILTKNKKGYCRHPETLRWKGKLAALFARHEKLVNEMDQRHYCHQSPLDKRQAIGSRMQKDFVHSIAQQKSILKSKGCDCRV